MTLLLLLVACDDAPTDTADPAETADSGDTQDTAEVTLDGTCADDVHWGAFAVESTEDYGYVTGAASDGVVPTSVLTNVLTTGDCTIWRRENPYCESGCDPGYTCGLDGACVPYPETQDLGTVTVDGLVADVAMEPIGPGYNYSYTDLPNPPWEEGALVTLRTGVGAFDPVTVHGYAPIALVPTSLEWVVVDGEPLVVGWDAPPGDVDTEVVLTLRIDQHGTTPSRIACVFEDDGAAEVPADVLQELLGLGLSGFPEGTLARRTADKVELAEGACLDLTVSSSRLTTVSVDGYTPCNDDRECPEGQTCNEAMQRCE